MVDVLTGSNLPKLKLNNLTGSAKAFYVASLFKILERDFIITLNDREEAGYFADVLAFLSKAKQDKLVQ